MQCKIDYGADGLAGGCIVDKDNPDIRIDWPGDLDDIGIERLQPAQPNGARPAQPDRLSTRRGVLESGGGLALPEVLAPALRPVGSYFSATQ